MERVARREAAFRRRVAAAQLARDRPHEVSYSNGEEGRYRDPDTGRPSYTANFTKGLPHRSNGQLANPQDYITYLRAIDSGADADIRRIPLGPVKKDEEGEPVWRSRFARSNNVGVRAWESMAGGLTYSLEGPDSHAVSMPPAPTLDSCELIAEMAELYLMALARDVPFSSWGNGKELHPLIEASIDHLNELKWFSSSRKECGLLTPAERGRRRGRVRISNIFRGITPGVLEGPYLSQFLILGSTQLGAENIGDELEGKVRYGAQTISQKVRIVEECRDYMTDFHSWLDAQDGADFRGLEKYEKGERFIATPRDLTAYVHYDALYQAYLTACIIMLENRLPFDPGLPFLEKDTIDKQQGFAHFGGPHILTLVTEVATRALKAVRYQKFNVHRRLRPEAVGGLIDENIRSVSNGGKAFPEVNKLVSDLSSILCKVEAHNHRQNVASGAYQSSKSKPKENGSCGNGNGTSSGSRRSSRSGCPSHLLPMAFPEGSPMHPAYGAGHGTVAGACVTILKAFFDSNHELDYVYEPYEDGSGLRQVKTRNKLRVGHELNKLAENIAIGRNWAGVHYFSDYIESMRLGEKIAIGILEEQKLLFGENFHMSVDLFDGTTLRI